MVIYTVYSYINTNVRFTTQVPLSLSVSGSEKAFSETGCIYHPGKQPTRNAFIHSTLGTIQHEISNENIEIRDIKRVFNFLEELHFSPLRK
jgi:hypothetical protein